MVKRCQRTFQSVVTKVMQTQEDQTVQLNSVLFAICCHTHSSTGYSPIHMLYNKDPIMSFELANKTKLMGQVTNIENETDMDCEYQDNNLNNLEGSPNSDVDEVFKIMEAIENEHKDIFANAGKQILKAQKHQAKCYNRRHATGTSFRLACLY